MVDDDLLDSVRSSKTGSDDGGSKSKKSSSKSEKSKEKETSDNNPVDASKTKKRTEPKERKVKGDSVKQDLFSALGKVFSFTKAMEDPFDEHDVPPNRRAWWKQTSRDIHECAFEHFGIYGVDSLAKKYGFDWQRITNKGQISTGNDKSMKKKDAEKLLKAMANAVLRAKGIVMEKKDKIDDGQDSEENRTRAKAAEEIYGSLGGILANHNVQRHAERFGFDWEDDIVKAIIEDQPKEKERLLGGDE